MKQITFSDKQFYDLLQFASEYTGNILERASEDWDSSYSQDQLKANENIINIHDFLCQCKHTRLTMSPDEHIGAFSLKQLKEFNKEEIIKNATN